MRERFSSFTKVSILSVLIAIIGFVPGLPGLSLFTETASAAPETIFVDSFEDDSFSKWSSTGLAGAWDTVDSDASDGSFRADGKGGSLTSELKATFDTLGYETINVSFDYKLVDYDRTGTAGYGDPDTDYALITANDGSSNYAIGYLTAPSDSSNYDSPEWTTVSSTISNFSASNFDNNPSIVIGFINHSSAQSEEFLIDNVVVTGEAIATDTTAPTATAQTPLSSSVIDTSNPSNAVVLTAEISDDVSSPEDMDVYFDIVPHDAGLPSYAVYSTNPVVTINPTGTVTWSTTVASIIAGTNMTDGDTFDWRVQATDEAGNVSAFSVNNNLQFGATASAVTNTDTGEMFDTLQEAHDDSDTDGGDTLVINEDLTTTSQVTITKSITIDGGGNTLDADFIKTNNSNNSAIGVQADNVAITNITVMSSGDQPYPDQLHGINVYQSTNVSVSYATVKDFYGTGIAYNGSTGSIQDVHTENNSWHGINVDKDGSNVSVTGNNTHDEPFADIYVDNDTLDVTVFAPAYDWERSGITGRDNDRVYRLSPVVEACNSSIFDSGFVDGTIDGQNGWKSTGTFDEEITDNTYGYPELGCKVLRLSNGLTSNAFGNQTFSSPSTNGLAGEDVVNDYFEAEFAFGSTEQSEQSGLALSISPDDGTGNRMSYLSLADTPTGTAVTFYDTNSTGGFVPTTLPELSRDVAHTVRFEIELVDGEANDVVRIYFDDSLVHTGTTWEQYYRYSSEQAGNGNIVPAIDRLLLRAAGTAVPSNVGGGYVFDNVSTITDTTVVPDITKPVVTIITPDVDSYNPAEIRVLATDETSLYRVTANIYDESNSTLLHPCSQLTGDVVEHELVCPVPALGDGVYTIRTNAQDNGDPHNTASTLSRQFTIDTSAPSINWQLQPQALYGSTDGFHVRPITTEVGTVKSVYIDSVDPSNLCYEKDSDHKNMDTKNTHCQALWDGLADGTHKFVAVFTDYADNSATSESAEFVIDRTKPAVSISTPANGTLTNSSESAINGVASDSNGIEKVDFTVNEIDSLGGSYLASVTSGTATGTDAWDFNITGLTSGFYRIKVQAFDNAGNWRYSYHDIEVDLDAPLVTINTIEDSTDTTPTITGTVDDNDAVVTVSINGTDYAATNNGDGTWTLEVVDPLAVGDYTVQAFATDVAGNATDPVATDNFSVTEEPDTTDSSGGTGVLGDNTGDEDISTPTTGGIGGDNTPLLLASSNNNTFTTQDTSDEESEESETSDDAEVLQSTTDESNADNSSDDEDDNEDESGCFKILGICWYWWALPIVAIILYYGYRRLTEEK